jgi:class 3 adenylate cyclase
MGPTWVRICEGKSLATQPGQVFVSQAIRDQLAPSDATDAGTFNLKGVDTPKTLFALKPGSH